LARASNAARRTALQVLTIPLQPPLALLPNQSSGSGVAAREWRDIRPAVVHRRTLEPAAIRSFLYHHLVSDRLPPAAASHRPPALRTETDLDFVGHRSLPLHPYPATMPFPVADSLVNEYSRAGELVIDPFAGSGTTLRASSAAARPSIGVELNPLAVLIARASTMPLDLDTDWARLERARVRILESATDGPARYPNDSWSTRLSRWYSDRAMAGLARLAAAVRTKTADPLERDIALVALSRTARRCSRARQGELKLWRRHNADLTAVDPATVFDEEFSAVLWSLLSFHSSPGLRAPVEVIHGDSGAAPWQSRRPNLILTSPPYGDAWTTVAYGNYSMLSRIWLSVVDSFFVQKDPVNEDRLSLGGRARERSHLAVSDALERSPALRVAYESVQVASQPRAEELAAFFADLDGVFERLGCDLLPGGRLVVVIGPRRVAGTIVDTGRILAEAMASRGFVYEERRTRKVTGKRLPTKTVQGAMGLADTINTETIDVLRKAA
jgi:site-specific DNA-methyltransferase (cytosine-N4-specific)